MKELQLALDNWFYPMQNTPVTQEAGEKQGGRASRLHAVRFRRTSNRYPKENEYQYKALVASSGSVKDGA